MSNWSGLGGFDGRDVVRLKAFFAFADRKFNELSLFEGTVAFGLDGAVMDENVRRTFTLDKSVAFCVVEPFDLALFAFAHDVSLRSVAPGGCCYIRQEMRPGPHDLSPEPHARRGATVQRFSKSSSAVPVDNYTSGKRKIKEAEKGKKGKKHKKKQKKHFWNVN